MNVLRGALKRGYHYLVEWRIWVNGNFVRRERRDVREVIKTEPLERDQIMRKYFEKLKDRWDNRIY